MAYDRQYIEQFYEAIRDERLTAANTATRIGQAFLMLLDYTASGFEALAGTIEGLDFDTYWEEYIDQVTGELSVHLRSQYVGAWADGFLSAKGMSPLGGGSGMVLNDVLTGINNTTFSDAHPSSVGQTIVWNGTTWTFGSAGGGGGISMNDVWTALATADSSKQIDASHLSSALSGYALVAQIPTNNNQLTNGAGYITSAALSGIMDDVWDALATADGTANSKQIDISHLQCIPSWAKQPTKPSYTFSEIASKPTKLAGYGITDAMLTKILSSTSDIDTLYDAGSYRFVATAQGTWPTGVTANYGQMLVICGGGDTVAQMFFPYGDTQAYLRVGNPMNANNGSWKGWKRLVTPDMNVAGATKLATARTLWGQSFDGTANVSGNMNSVGSITMSGSITMDNNTAIRMKDNSDNTVSLLHMDTGGNFVIGETADIYSHNTYLRGANFIFQQGTTSANRKELFRIDSTGSLYMKQYNTVLNMRSSANADYNVLTLNTNPNAAYSNWHLALGYGTAGVDYGTRIFGGATTGIKFLCGQTTEVASIYKDSSRQGIKIGDALLSWDSGNNALKVSKIVNGQEQAANLFALGGVSALGFTAPTSSLDAFTIDYLTSTKVTTGTLDVSTKINLGSSNCYIQAGSTGNLTINASAGLTLGNSSVYSDPTGGLHASKFYLDSSRYLYVSSGTLYYYNGTTSKQVMLS